MVRVPTLQYHFIARVLDVGAMGVVVPMVADAAQARTIVESAKYPPVGRRGLAFGIAHDDYAIGDLSETMREANDEVMLIAQIETPGGVEQADAIAAVEGIDALWIGQYDLTATMGIPGRFDEPAFHEATARVVEACRRRGKTAVLGSGSAETLRDGPAAGYRMLVYLADLWIYQTALRQGLAVESVRLSSLTRIGSGRIGPGQAGKPDLPGPNGLQTLTSSFIVLLTNSLSLTASA